MTAAVEQELLLANWPFLTRAAWRASGLLERDDLRQVGAIAVLAEYRKTGITNEEWLGKCAMNAMNNANRDARAKIRGGPGEGNPFTDQHRAAPTDPADLEWLDTRPHRHEGLEWAYHRAEIWAVVNDVCDPAQRKQLSFRGESSDQLSENQRRYVILRFWLDLHGGELAEQLGLHPRASPGGIWGRARPKLQQRLNHLKDAA